MKAVILAGGFGTRLSEETVTKPKPMVEIGGKPILWHILKIYSYYGINEFIICCGYKGYMIKEYFANYFLHQSDVTFDIKKNGKWSCGCGFTDCPLIGDHELDVKEFHTGIVNGIYIKPKHTHMLSLTINKNILIVIL